jgi:hypothetical protein
VSSIAWKLVLRPSPSDAPLCRVYDIYDGKPTVSNVAAFTSPQEPFGELPDVRAHRALSRVGRLLVAAGLPSHDVLFPLVDEDPFSVGIYCAMEDGPEDYNSAKQMADTPSGEFASAYRALRSPKQSLKQLGSIPPSQLGIFLGVMGPQYVFCHSHWACLHALEQAEIDLSMGTVRAALVCGAFTLDDPLLSMRIRRSLPSTSLLSEAAAAVVLTRNGEYSDWRSIDRKNDRCCYGTAHDLVLIAIGGEKGERS